MSRNCQIRQRKMVFDEISANGSNRTRYLTTPGAVSDDHCNFIKLSFAKWRPFCSSLNNRCTCELALPFALPHCIEPYYRFSIYRGVIWHDVVENKKGSKFNFVQTINSEKTSHTSPLWASYGAYFLSYFEKGYRETSTMHCFILPLNLNQFSEHI